MDDLARPGFEGAKYVFIPPLREKKRQPKLWDGLTNDHLHVVSSRLFGLYPRKAGLASAAAIVVWDPRQEHTIGTGTHHMPVDYSLFEGFRVKGNARMVLSRGEVIEDGGRYLGGAGRGQFLKRAAHSGAWK